MYDDGSESLPIRVVCLGGVAELRRSALIGWDVVWSAGQICCIIYYTPHRLEEKLWYAEKRTG